MSSSTRAAQRAEQWRASFSRGALEVSYLSSAGRSLMQRRTRLGCSNASRSPVTRYVDV